jgi:hypothetical protein
VPHLRELYPGICLTTEEKPRKTSVRVVMCNKHYKTTFNEGKQFNMETETRTGLQWKIFVFLCTFVAYCTFCCQISETVRETQTWKRNIKLKQDLGS